MFFPIIDLTFEPSDKKRAFRYFLSGKTFLHLSKKEIVLKKMQKKKTLQKPSPIPKMSFFVGGHTLRLTGGRAFHCPFLENQLAGLRALSHLAAHLCFSSALKVHGDCRFQDRIRFKIRSFCHVFRS